MFDTQHKKEFVIYTFSGIASMLIAIATNPACQKNRDIVKDKKFYAYAHGLWHILFPYGAHLIIQMIILMECVAKGVEYHRRRYANKALDDIFSVFPLIEN